MTRKPLPPGAVRTPPHPGEVPRGEPLLSRREFIRNSVRLAVAGALIPGLATQLLPAVPATGAGASAAGPVIRRGANNAKIPITIADLKPQPANPPLVGEWGFLPAAIYMVRTDILRAAAAKRGYNTGQFAVAHPTEGNYSIMVYRAKCKHLGCTVGWNGGLGGSKDVEDYDLDGLNDGRILCPCHQGQYDIYDLALNQPATPPPAPLDVIRFNVGSYSDPEGVIPSAANALIGTEVITQGKYREADLDGVAGQTAFLLASQASRLGGA
jgi:Rieske Fe-S protein